MTSIAECLERINALTQQNLEILKTLNDSFFTKNEHLVVNVDDNKYVIPSFLSLENKVNALQEGLNNLINAPATGEAYFNYDGNSKTIQVRGFNNTPNALSLKSDDTGLFYVDENSFFKDMISPDAHLKFDVSSIPDDISSVIVKKVVPISDTAKELLHSQLKNEDEEYDQSAQVAYKDLYKQLSLLKKGVDYEEYDTVRQLPIRQSIGTGTYVITKILKDEILGDLTEQLTLDISNNTPLYYKKFDETIDVALEPGQYLTTYDDRVKLRIVDINRVTNQLILNVVNGDYLDLAAYEDTFENIDDVPAISKLRFFSVNDFSKDKYVDVTLEEDQYIGIFIAPLNGRMNVQAPWGTGVVVDSYAIKFADDETQTYDSFYKSNVRNIGDILKEIVTITNNSIMKYGQDQFDAFTGYTPTIDVNKLDVVQINRHLNNSPTIQRIRSLYSQKKQYEIDLNEILNKINETNATLASVSFDDTTNMRSIYEAQLDDYTKKKNEIVSAINSIINEISLAVNNSDVPIENAKYHIRGYFDWNTDDEILNTYRDHIKGIRVEYRYKNKDQVSGTAESIQNGSFIYSDWNRMYGFDRQIHPSIQDDKYVFEYDANTDEDNVPSFNQIDIPITQGETVDIRLRVVWDFGYPYIETLSDWSEAVNIEFPQEYLKDVQILTIVEENNSDIETNRFNNILIDNGVIEHVSDKQIDQDMTYFHHPEHIASGFYTEERRVIPLKDKLSTMDNAIVNLEDVVYGSNSENVQLEFVYDDTSTLILPDQDNNVNVSATVYSESSGTKLVDCDCIANLKITNKSSRSLRLYSIFPGNRNKSIQEKGRFIYDDKNRYNIRLAYNDNFIESSGNYFNTDDSQSYQYGPQVRNQFIYLRSKDVYDEKHIVNAFALVDGSASESEKAYTNRSICTLLVNTNKGQICVDSDNIRDFKIIEPGESIILPIIFTFSYVDNNSDIYTINDLEMSIDLRLSLYTDPINYFIKIHHVEEEDATLHDKIVQSQTNLKKYNSVVASVYDKQMSKLNRLNKYNFTPHN